MGYQLGIDIGTTYTAAAIHRDGKTEMLGLGNRAMQVPSVLYLTPGGEFLVGDAAEARAAAEPEGVVREFKRRIGDPVPILVGGTPFSAEALTAKLLARVVKVATEREGERPEAITVSHPANWGEFKTDLLRQSFRLADLADVQTCTEPEAAAVSYAARQRVADGECVAVYDLGGGTFDAAVLRNGQGRFSVLGTPEGIEHLGGVDFDEALFQHVLRSIGADEMSFDPDDPEVVWTLGRLRRECVEAKELLSADTEAVVTVALGQSRTTVRLTRGEFEDMLRPTIEETVGTMRRVLRSANVEIGQVSAFVLVGGSSRIPLITEVLISAFGRPLAIDTHPKHDIALGAALLAAGGAEPGAVPAASAPALTPLGTDLVPPPPPPPPDEARVLPRPDRPSARTGRGGGFPRSRRSAVLAAVIVAIAAAGAVTYAVWPDNGSSPALATTKTPSPTRSSEARTTPTTHPALPPNMMLIARSVGTGPNSIWSVPTTGGVGKSLTDGKHDDGLPVMSRDRTLFAYVRGASQTKGSTVRLMNTDGTDDRSLFRSRNPQCPSERRPAFRPHSTDLAMQCWFGAGHVALDLVTRDGRIKSTLIPAKGQGLVGDPTFSPSGDQIAFWQRPAGSDNTRIATVPSTPGSVPTAVTNGLARDDNPAWSPKGNLIAFSRTVGRNSDIYLYDVSTTHVTRLTTGPQIETDPSWSPDGNRIAYMKGPSTDTQVWITNVSGSLNPHPLSPTRTGATERWQAWSAR